MTKISAKLAKFQSTPPVKAATMSFIGSNIAFEFQSTPPVKAATKTHFLFLRIHTISIHAAREGGDLHHPESSLQLRHFNPRRP